MNNFEVKNYFNKCKDSQKIASLTQQHLMSNSQLDKRRALRFCDLRSNLNELHQSALVQPKVLINFCATKLSCNRFKEY